MSELKTRTVTMTLTQSCNLACSYCYEHHKSSMKMEFATAKRIIDQEFSNAAGVEAFEFDLFGGEPFLEFDLIKQITEYICEKKGDIPCTVFVTTNGTLVHGEVQVWLKEHSCCFVCGLSLDGTREMHNLNRSNSYDDIDLDFFLSVYPLQDVKMTVSQETLPMLAEGVIDLHNKGFLVSCNLAYEIDWSDADNMCVLNRELSKLIDYYLEHPDIEPCSMLEMGINNVSVDSEGAARYCGAGKYMCAYDIDGQRYPCQFFMPLSVGKEKAKAVSHIDFPEDIVPKEMLDDKCKGCVIRSVCPNCFGANYANTGSIYKRDDNLCRLTKVIIKARSYFRARQWEKGQLNLDEEDMQSLMYAIIKVQEELEL